MKQRRGFPSGHITARAAAILEELEFFLQVQTVEALLAPHGEASPDNGVARLLVTLGEPPRSARRKLARYLMQVNINTNEPLSGRDKMRLQEFVDPKAQEPLLARIDTVDRLKALMPDRPADPSDQRAVWTYVNALSAEFGQGAGPSKSAKHSATSQSTHQGRSGDRSSRDDMLIQERGVIGPWDPNPRPIPYNYLDFVVEHVLCLDTTNGEAGPDEIMISADFIDFSREFNLSGTGDIPTVAQAGFHDQGQMRSGNQRSRFPQPLHTFDLREKTMPHFVDATVTMAERDPAGGFGDFMNDRFAMLQAFASPPATMPPDFISLGLAGNPWHAFGPFLAIVLAAFGGYVGFKAGGPWGALAGAIVGLTFGIFYNIMFLHQNRDEIFPPQLARLVLIPRTFADYPFYGGTRSVTERLHFETDGGAYDVFYHWQFHNTPPEQGHAT